MDVEAFAERYRLKTRLDNGAEKIISGKHGQIYDYGDGRYGVVYRPDPQGLRPVPPVMWNSRKHWMLAAGFSIHVDCDGEGIALFDPYNRKQVRLALQVAGVKPKRIMSEAQRAVLEKAREASPLISRVTVRSGMGNGKTRVGEGQEVLGYPPGPSGAF